MLFKAIKQTFKFNNLYYSSIKYFADQSQKMQVLDATNIKKIDHKHESTLIQPWVDVEKRLEKLRGELVLSQTDQIEKYVLSVIRGYFRTTYKEGLNLESKLEDHGLDSLDTVEISMVLEDELGKFVCNLL